LQTKGSKYTIGFALVTCVICSAVICIAAVSLKTRIADNRLLDKQKKVLVVTGLMEEGESIAPEEVSERFTSNIVARVIDLETGEYVPEDEIDPDVFDQQSELSDPALSREAPANPAQVSRLPKHAQVYHVLDGETISKIVLPVEGKGLWSTLYGFLVLENDTNTIGGITFYKHGETPGLGGEVDNPKWKAKWIGRKAYDDSGAPAIRVVKGYVGSAEEDPYKVDALSGATITSNGVSFLMTLWLGDDGFGPYLNKFRAEHGGTEAG
jgi:Na+-transporting NADH:ubiquinone oxidoreductase subunit C